MIKKNKLSLECFVLLLREQKDNGVIGPLFAAKESVLNYLAFSGMNRAPLKLAPFI